MNIETISIFWELTILRGRRRLVMKINITFSVRNEVLNIFYLTIFLKRTIFSKITLNNNFWGHDNFSGKGASDDKNEYITFSMGNGVPNIVLKFFLQKSSYQLNEGQKAGFAGKIFPYQWFYGPIISKNNWAHSRVDLHVPCEFNENQFETASCFAYSYKSVLTWQICNQEPPK